MLSSGDGDDGKRSWKDAGSFAAYGAVGVFSVGLVKIMHARIANRGEPNVAECLLECLGTGMALSVAIYGSMLAMKCEWSRKHLFMVDPDDATKMVPHWEAVWKYTTITAALIGGGAFAFKLVMKAHTKHTANSVVKVAAVARDA